ncbi:ImmA/IrrE family metallo-endopeptidase [Protaetiibacter sp. SSC-01]|uniref:ImmA/IrrE family metallo-endopeptidase n=1 Tax=Protaetiibacter sp. SSC-01 TaxID=2759943 RepID=UPI0016569F15|nr:ImmA/IrrE family metallo-endopeptidase [Protaetiibacter sp. SSC-01]QNO38652.1 ImmA/IrrE family metallo-endopeptidase [Protaetiibacter sp. SSC-01]
MAQVRVTALRFSSMLENRGMQATHVRDGLKVEVDVERLASEDLDLEFEQLVALAKRFKKPWPYLLVDAPETLGARPRDNRTLANRRHPLSPELVDEVMRVEAMLEASADLFPEIAFEVPTSAITLNTPVVDAAAAIRELLGVSWEAQIGARGDYASLRLWSLALQERGIYVSMRRLEDATVRAFSLVSGEQAVVVADTQDVPYARIFSLLHEYTHVVLRTAGVCDLDDYDTVERYCNAVAATVLMPGALLRRELPKRTWGTSIEADEKEIAALANRLGVSKASLLIRLRDYGTLSQEQYDVLERRRSERRGGDEKPGGTYYPAAINKVGRRFARGVVGAYEAGTIDRQDASTLLEIPEHNFHSFRVELAKAGRGE